MALDQPLVSIGIPVYNGEDFLSEALDSIINQTYPNLEILVSDNGSTDQTPKICRRYQKIDRRIYYFREEENRGATWNFNQVLRLASGKYFRWAAHDDLLAPNLIQKCVEILENNPEVVLCHSKVQVIDENGQFKHDYDIELATYSPSPPARFFELLIRWNMYYEIFGLIRRQAFSQVGEMGSFSHADGILLERLSLIGRFHQLDEILFFPRFHPRQSNQVYGLNYQAYSAWFDPRLKGQRVYPYWRQFKEHLSAVKQAKITLIEKLNCYLAISYWMFKRRRELAKDLFATNR